MALPTQHCNNHTHFPCTHHTPVSWECLWFVGRSWVGFGWMECGCSVVGRNWSLMGVGVSLGHLVHSCCRCRHKSVVCVNVGLWLVWLLRGVWHVGVCLSIVRIHLRGWPVPSWLVWVGGRLQHVVPWSFEGGSAILMVGWGLVFFSSLVGTFVSLLASGSWLVPGLGWLIRSLSGCFLIM